MEKEAPIVKFGKGRYRYDIELDETLLEEIKVYQAQLRTLEAEAGLKPNEIKLDLNN